MFSGLPRLCMYMYIRTRHLLSQLLPFCLSSARLAIFVIIITITPPLKSPSCLHLLACHCSAVLVTNLVYLFVRVCVFNFSYFFFPSVWNLRVRRRCCLFTVQIGSTDMPVTLAPLGPGETFAPTPVSSSGLDAGTEGGNSAPGEFVVVALAAPFSFLSFPTYWLVHCSSSAPLAPLPHLPLFC